MKYSTLFLSLVAIFLSVEGAMAQARLSEAELMESLQTLDDSRSIDVVALRRKAADSVAANRTPSQGNLADELQGLSQLGVEISFKFDSAAIEPESFRTIGLIADALHHPTLLQYKFLVVGHADAKGTQKYNLELSQKRADAVRDALVTTFRIASNRVAAIGLGEEQLRNDDKPNAGVNRRVQLVNIGKAK